MMVANPTKTTTAKSNPRRKTVRPTSSFLWFTKSPKVKPSKSAIVREDDFPLEKEASSAWWKPANLPKPTNIKTLSAYLLDSSKRPTKGSNFKKSTTQKLKKITTTTSVASSTTTQPSNDWNDLLAWSNKYVKP